jgi:tetratricopeptide (TPR) repeat protein
VPSAEASWRLTILAAGAIVLAALAAYLNSLGGTFAYDDQFAIVENPTIRHLWPIWPVLSPPRSGETVSGRPLLNLSLAINYALGGLNVRGYHAVNLAIHIGAALLLFGILRRTFLVPILRERFGKAAPLLALASALLWTVHPLQTESVTYIVQRAESLAGLFYLLTLYCVIRGAGEEGLRNLRLGLVATSLATSPLSLWERVRVRVPVWKTQTMARVSATSTLTPALSQREREMTWPALLWYVAAVVACLLGMACKEVLVTAPLTVLLYDRTFLAGSFAEAWRRRWGLYAGLAASWGLLVYLVASTGLIGRQTELSAPDAWSYARSQPGVILYYLRLSVWPSPLCLEYAWPVASKFGEVFPGAMVLGLLLAATAWGVMAGKAWALLGAWFLLILAPTSSILPLTALAHEHRMYLSLAAVVVLAVAGGYALWDRLLPLPARSRRGATLLRWAAPALVLAAVLTASAYATVARNWDYRTVLTIYQDTVDKRPHNPTSHIYLGNALADAGRIDEALEHYHAALRQIPDYVEGHNNLANALAAAGKTGEAIEHYHQALRLRGNDVEAHNNLGNVLAQMGRTDEAIQHYQQVLRLRPDYAETHNNLGNALAALRRTDEAMGHYERALRLKPDYAEAHHNLANALAVAGRWRQAVEHWQEAVRLKPDYLEAHYNLGNVLSAMGRTHEALAHYEQVLHLVPDSIEALNNLAWLLATREAARGGDPARAVKLAQQACELSGQEKALCLDTLAAAYAAAGRFDDAVITAERARALAESTGRAPLAKLIQDRLELYRAGQPCREAPQSPGQTRP